MDQLRASVKALFYDNPIENAFGMIVGTDSKGKFLQHFSAMPSVHDAGLTPHQMDSFKTTLQKDLRDHKFRKDNDIQLFVGLPLLFAEKVLTKDGDGYPRVQFTNLLRWREVVKHLGEDLFTTSFLAQADNQPRADFFWPNVIPHDNEKINAALDGGLCDIHAHFGGAIDSFQFNWICLMNDVGGLYDKFELMKESFNQAVVFDKDYSFKNLSLWCRVAAGIRVCLYKVLVKDQPFRKDETTEALLSLGTGQSTEEITRLKETIDALRTEAKLTRDGLTLDYAISEDLVTDEFASSPYCIYAGERQIEYIFYRNYLREPSKLKGALVELFYLYELIKTHLRREFVCANERAGLDNYIGFGARTALFTKKIEPVCNLSAMQTSIRRDKDDYIETRVTWNALGLTMGEYWKGLYTSEPFIEKEEMRRRLTFVVQLSKGVKQKNEHKEGRYYKKKKEVHAVYNDVACFKGSKQSAYEIVGLDVGGLELYYRPEVFAHMLRAGKKQGFHVTYHVGEEFYDLVDGMRAVWEVIRFTESLPVDRLGHCVALGMKPDCYYAGNHYTLSMPKQVMLDNLVWLCCFAEYQNCSIKPRLLKRLSSLANELYQQIGYDKYFAELNMEDYYQSMLLRSDEANEEDGLDNWSLTAELDTNGANVARNNANAKRLCKAYQFNEDVIEAGEDATMEVFDKDYAELVAHVQRKMIEGLNEKGLCVESCPSSNLQICQLERYDHHPAFLYYLCSGVRPFWSFVKKPKMNFAICTDDKGTFSTSLHNEFSLLALAAKKGRAWNHGVERDFAELVKQGNKYRFKS